MRQAFSRRMAIFFTNIRHYIMKRILLPLLMLASLSAMQAQVNHSANYPDDQKRDIYAEQQAETNPIIVQRLDEWKDLKFGFMVHWGPYSQWGVVESWSICSEPWISRNGANYMTYVQNYWNLNRTFKPNKFDANRWAKVAADAGMKYVVFTTKHHDGFCMFDSKYSTYTIANKDCPYSKNTNNDITRDVVESFRAKGFWTGLYFSKPDWHCPDYWAPEWATPDRNVNYDPTEHPDRWKRYVDFTFNQIYELTHNYGAIDILWLDGGWIRPEWSINDETRPWLGCQGYVQDVNMPRIARMARENIPDLLIVDRSVGGKYENYTTPEKQVPDVYMAEPWETCMTMGDSWSWVKDDNYKSTNTLVHILCDVVCKGGNLLLNVGPDANGELPDPAVQRLKEIGRWMKVNSECIYSTRPASPHSTGRWRFTQSKDGKVVYAIYLLDEGETMPEVVDLPRLSREPLSARLLDKSKVRMRQEGDHYQLFVQPKEASHAVVFRLVMEK